jgi:[ribosomal protein S5]-alanine N-acetyltransferase
MGDLGAFHTILSDPKAMAYWSTPPHQDVEQSRTWLQAMVEISPGGGEDFVIEYQGQVVGKAGLFRFPEIGFILHPDVWSQGFAAEALRPVLTRAFDRHGLQAVDADVDPRNEACLRLLEKFGFRELGRRENAWLVGERWCDSVDLRLARAEFQT